MLNRHPRWKLPFPSAWGLAGTNLQRGEVVRLAVWTRRSKQHQWCTRHLFGDFLWRFFLGASGTKTRRFRPSVLNTRRPSGSLAAPRTTGWPKKCGPFSTRGKRGWRSDVPTRDFGFCKFWRPGATVKNGADFLGRICRPWRIQRCRWIPAKTLGCKASTRDAISAAMGRTIIGCRGHASCVQGRVYCLI